MFKVYMTRFFFFGSFVSLICVIIECQLTKSKIRNMFFFSLNFTGRKTLSFSLKIVLETGGEKLNL